ncbi:MAG: hypothetical protein ACI30W_07020 [Muribaculaceae bacterium]
MKRLALALTLAAALCAAGCCRHVVADSTAASVAHTEALLSHNAMRDTLICRDTLTVVQRGDTVRERAVAWRYRSLIVHDTVERTLTDTVTVTRTVTVSKTAPWAPLRRAVALTAYALGAIVIVYVAIRLRRRLG